MASIRHRRHALAVPLALGVALALAGCGDTDDSGTDAGVEDSATVTDVEVFNLAPVVEITGPTEGQVFQLGDPISVVAKVGDDQDSPATLPLTLSSDVDGDLGEVQANDAGFVTFEIGSLSPGIHELTMTVEDSAGLDHADAVTIEVNAGPTVAEVIIKPDNPTTLDDLEAELTVPFTDPNRAADQLVVTWEWFKDGEDTGLPGATVPSDRTFKGETWRVLVTAEDPYGKRAQAEATATIGNAPPTCGAAILLPASGGTDDDFTCACSARAEPDAGDPHVDTCEFFDGETALTSDNCTLPASSTNKGMAIRCRLTASDGEEAAATVETVTALVFNQAPTQPEVSVTPATGTTGDTYTCSVTNTPVDLDGDSYTLEYTWIVNNYSNPTGTATSVVPKTDLVSDASGSPANGGDTLRCRVRAFDGTDRSPPGTSQLVVMANTPPTGGTVTLTPPSPTEDDTLTCSASGATDADGDPISWHIEWVVNGEVLEDADTSTLLPARFDPGDEITCQARPADAVAQGPLVEAGLTVTITNTPPTAPEVAMAAPLGADGPVTCLVTVPATDKEDLTEVFYWTINGGAEFVGEATLPDDQIAPCNMLSCRLVVSDGTTEVSSSVAAATMPVGSCDDSDPCTTSVCLPSGTCETTFNSGPCNDLDPCTSNDTCDQGVCNGVPKTCDDEQFCTIDSCNPENGNCINVLDDTLCVDDNICTNDRCSFQANGGLGGCVFDAADDVPCDADGDGCTLGDHCLNKECVPGEAFDCEEGQEPAQCFLRQCESVDSSTFTCEIVPFDTKVVCDDGLFCTIEDKCDGSGVCVGGGERDCNEGLGVCQYASCNEAQNQCAVENFPNETPCDADSNGCTIDDSCQNGQCTAGAEPDCTAEEDECNLSACVSLGTESYECVPVPKDVGTPCTSDDYCIINKTCDAAGACSGGQDRDCDEALGDQCTTAYCNSQLELCIPQLINNGTPCDDGDPCTAPDACSFGTCIATNTICAEEPLSVEQTTTRRPVLEAIGQGRFVAQWYDVAVGANVFRVSNMDSSREEAERAVGEGVLSASNLGPKYRVGAIGSGPNGYLLLSGDGDYSCPIYNWCGSTGDRTLTIASRGAVYDLLDEPGAAAGLQSYNVTKPVYGVELEIGMHMAAVGFNDGSFGALFSINSPDTCTAYGCYSPSPSKGIRYTSMTADLTREPAVLLQATGGKSVQVFAASSVPGGNEFVLAWLETGSGVGDISVRRFDSLGAALADPLTIDVDDGASVAFVDIAVNANGRVAVAWQQALSGGPPEVKAVVMDDVTPTSTVLPLAVEAVADSVLGGIDLFADDAAVVTWAGPGQDSDTDVFVQVVEASGTPIDGPSIVHGDNAGNQLLPNVVTVDGDSFAVAFAQEDGTLWTRTYDRNGAASPGAIELEVSQTPSLDQREPVASSDGGTSALVVWEQTSIGATISDVFMRQYDSAGLPMMEQARVNTATVGAQNEPAVGGGAGRFAVAWTSDGQDGDGLGVYAKIVPSDGSPASAEFPLDDLAAGDQDRAAVGIGATALVGAWRSGGAVRARGFSLDGTAMGPAWVVDAAAASESNPRIAMLSDGSVIVAYQKAGSVSGVGRFAASGSVQVAPIEVPSADGHPVSGTLVWPVGDQLALCRVVTSPDRVECLALDSDTLATMGAPNTVGAAANDRLGLSSVASGVVVAWSAADIDGAGQAVSYQRLGSDMARTSPAIVANRFRDGDQSWPFVVGFADAAEPFLIGWQSADQDGSGLGVYMRALDFSDYPSPQ